MSPKEKQMSEVSKKNKWIIGLVLAGILGISLFFYGTASEKALFPKEDLSEYRSEKENELAVFLEESRGVEEVTVKLCLDENGKIIGAAVVCAGGNDPAVRAQIVRLLSAALGLSTNRIEVSGKG